MNRTLSVARMQLVNKSTFIWTPLAILGGSLAIAFILFMILPDDIGLKFVGAGQAPLWYFFALGITTLSMTFPFSQAMSVSRRTFFIGTTFVVACASAVLATLYCVMALVERWTNGYGLDGYMFDIPWVMTTSLWQGWLLIFLSTLLFFMIGFTFTAIFKRFGALWLTITLFAVAFVLLGGVWFVTHHGLWLNVGHWFAAQTTLSVSGILAVVVVAMGLVSFVSIRRMIP